LNSVTNNDENPLLNLKNVGQKFMILAHSVRCNIFKRNWHHIFSLYLSKKYGIAVKLCENWSNVCKKKPDNLHGGQFSKKPHDEIFWKPHIYDMAGVP
jgi:hypothetical protein